MSDRDDLLRKLRGLRSMTEAAGATPEEAASAQAMANKLMARHGIAEAEVGEAEEAGGLFDGLFGGFGLDSDVLEEIQRDAEEMLQVARELRSHRLVIKTQMAAALAAADKLNPRYRAMMICEFYRDIKVLLGDSMAWHRDLSIKERRDAAVKADYQAVKAEHLNGYWAKHDPALLHISVRDEVAHHTGLRRDTVERIVGVFERTLWEEQMTCDICGESGKRRRGKPAPKWTKVPGGHQIILHPDCQAAKEAGVAPERIKALAGG